MKSELRNKKWSRQKAVEYFDDFYKPVFSRQWPSIRLGLLCPSNYCAVVNNFSNSSEHEQVLLECGATEVKPRYEKEAEDDGLNSAHPDPKEENEDDDVLARKGIGLHQFVPATKTLGLEDHVDETDYAKSYDPYSFVPFQKSVEPVLSFPEYLKVYVFPRNDMTVFPPPKRDVSGLFGFYLMDAASILPVFYLNIKPGDKVLDLCSAPGGKALSIKQTLNPGILVCNDPSEARMLRLKNVFKDYVPDLSNLKHELIFTNLHAERWTENNVYDKVLVDVPCTNDRTSANIDDNNWFGSKRLKERIALPEIQINILYAALLAVKAGGSVVYSTCSLSPIQNDGVVHMALKKVYEKTNMNFTIADLTEATNPFNFLFRFHKDLRYGQLVVPFLPLNYGPMYFCKLNRDE